jgi:hypothetical protein
MTSIERHVRLVCTPATYMGVSGLKSRTRTPLPFPALFPAPSKTQVNLQTADQKTIPARVGVSGAVRGYVYCRNTRRLLVVGATDNTVTTHRRKHEALRVACSKAVHCVNAFRIGSSNSSFSREPCAGASIAFVAGVTSLSVDYTAASFHSLSSLLLTIIVYIRRNVGLIYAT